MSEVAKRIESFVEAGVKSIAPLVIQPGMFKEQKSDLIGSKVRLAGAAKVIDFVLIFSGLETRIMFNEHLGKYVLVATL